MTKKQEKIKEEWKDVAGYEGLYQVSSMGSIKSLARTVSNGKGSFFKNEKLLKPYLDKDGYLTVNLYSNKSKKLFKIHRLVATAFISNPESKPSVNHKNSLRNDNCISNLEWTTFSENNQHAFDFGNKRPMKGDKCWLYNLDPSLHPNARKVINTKTGRVYESLIEATKDLRLKYAHVLSKINLKQQGFNDTGLSYLDDLTEIPQIIKVRVGTTVFDYELVLKSNWISIESEADLPKESGLYFVRRRVTGSIQIEEIKVYAKIKREFALRNFTHWQKIETPKPPIY